MIPSPLSQRQDWSPPELLLEAAADDDTLIIKLIDAFSTDTGARIDTMRQALAGSDFTRIRAEAHTIKGSASQMGADALAEACRELEMAANLHDARLISPWLTRIQGLFDDMRGAMSVYAGGGNGEPLVTP